MASPQPTPASRRPFFPPPFRISQFHGSTITTATPRKRRKIAAEPDPDSSSSADRKLSVQRMQSSLRLHNRWSSLVEKYSTPLDEDDEIDLFTGHVVLDRGAVRRMEKISEIGDLIEGDDPNTGIDGEADDEEDMNADEQHQEHFDPQSDLSEDSLGDEDDEDYESDDEIGGWGPCSGLDNQYRVVPPLAFGGELGPEDEKDLREFEEAERQRRELSESKPRALTPPSSAGASDDEFASFDAGEGGEIRLLHDGLEDLDMEDETSSTTTTDPLAYDLPSNQNAVHLRSPSESVSPVDHSSPPPTNQITPRTSMRDRVPASQGPLYNLSLCTPPLSVSSPTANSARTSTLRSPSVRPRFIAEVVIPRYTPRKRRRSSPPPEDSAVPVPSPANDAPVGQILTHAAFGDQAGPSSLPTNEWRTAAHIAHPPQVPPSPAPSLPSVPPRFLPPMPFVAPSMQPMMPQLPHPGGPSPEVLARALQAVQSLTDVIASYGPPPASHAQPPSQPSQTSQGNYGYPYYPMPMYPHMPYGMPPMGMPWYAPPGYGYGMPMVPVASSPVKQQDDSMDQKPVVPGAESAESNESTGFPHQPATGPPRERGQEGSNRPP